MNDLLDIEAGTEKLSFYAHDLKLATQENTPTPTLAYTHLDHLCGASIDTDAAGNVLQLTDYYPYGDSRIESTTTAFHDDYTYTGKERDEDTTLLYYEARYYDSHLGRFISRDPQEGDIKNPQSLNRYTYVLNNPLKYVDPNGEETKIAIRLTDGYQTLNPNEKDFGHIMIKIDDTYYGWLPSKSIFGSDGVMTRKSHADQMSSTKDYANGTFLYFTINIDDSRGGDEDKLQAELDAKYIETHKTGDERTDKEQYTLMTNDCVDVAMRYLGKYIPELGKYNGTPEELATLLWNNSFLKPAYLKSIKGGYTVNSQFTSVPLSQTKKNMFGQESRKTVYGIFKEIRNAQKKKAAQ